MPRYARVTGRYGIYYLVVAFTTRWRSRPIWQQRIVQSWAYILHGPMLLSHFLHLILQPVPNFKASLPLPSLSRQTRKKKKVSFEQTNRQKKNPIPDANHKVTAQREMREKNESMKWLLTENTSIWHWGDVVNRNQGLREHDARQEKKSRAQQSKGLVDAISKGKCYQKRRRVAARKHGGRHGNLQSEWLQKYTMFEWTRKLFWYPT